MSYFLRQFSGSLIFLLLVMLVCLFFIGSAQRYNDIVSFRIDNEMISTLERVRNEDADVLKMNVYRSRINWIAGRVCLSKYIESQTTNPMELYNWTIDDFAMGVVTLNNNGKVLVYSFTDCSG